MTTKKKPLPPKDPASTLKPPPSAIQGVTVPGGTDYVNTSQGYDNTSQATYPSAADFGASGYLLRSDGAFYHLWISDITCDFGVAGTTGQSRMVREWFPKSFNDVTLHITGNVASNSQYMQLAAYIREHQWLALANINTGHTADQRLEFGLYNSYGGVGGWPGGNVPATPVMRAGSYGGMQAANSKGAHLPWIIKGYVMSIATGAKAGEVAPPFEIDVVVTDSAGTGIWNDTSQLGGSQLNSILQILDIPASSVQSDPKHWIQDPVTTISPTAVTKGTTDVGGSVGLVGLLAIEAETPSFGSAVTGVASALTGAAKWPLGALKSLGLV